MMAVPVGTALRRGAYGRGARPGWGIPYADTSKARGTVLFPGLFWWWA